MCDDDLAILLKNVGPDCLIYMRGTSVSYMVTPEGRKVHVTGCPTLSGLKSLGKKLVSISPVFEAFRCLFSVSLWLPPSVVILVCIRFLW